MVSDEVVKQREKNMNDPKFLASEAEELHEFLTNDNVPIYSEDGGILPLIDRVILYKALCVE